MNSVSALRRWAAAVLVVVPLGVSALPALASDFTATRDAWLRTEEALDETHATLEVVHQATDDATAAFLEVERELKQARARLATLRTQLAQAVRQQRRADRENDVAIRRLGQATMVLVTIEDALTAHAADLDTEIVAAYKYAGSSARFRGLVEALQESGSVTDFTIAYEQLRTGTVGQKRLVDSVTALAERLVTQQAIVRELQKRTAAAKAEAVSRRRAVQRLTTEQTQLVAEIRTDRARRQRLLRQLKKEQAKYTKRAQALQAESDALLQELGKYRYVGGAPGSKDLLWPTDGALTSGFGYRTHPIFKTRRMHAGIDIPAPTGQPIFAAADGVVSSAGVRGGYGNVVVIDHGEGLSTVYAHQSRMTVSTGEDVDAGDVIGHVGSTGWSTGPHLHFEVRLGGTPVDPMEWY
ncbi:MAG TPA: peptidoglycan DD-metalloendopeptidase family protein [Egibacteraceae bacterium]|nr:peptidoglycan DD-metalloendopeptidase family protein [Egibacteraceae bacterium]HVM14588.1 peptidoglycan DD-metalloendopeptidase family protein [Egibacteraceae bacterium]